MISRNVELYIEELILHGFAPSDRYPIGEAVEQELTRLLTVQGVPPSLAQGKEVASLDGGSFEVTAGAKPEAIGNQVAQAIYGGLNP